jgi:hypothetical protein
MKGIQSDWGMTHELLRRGLLEIDLKIARASRLIEKKI